jgi:putative ABC transport system permease protein
LAGLIVLLMVGLFVGIGKAFNAPNDRSPADLMVLSAKSTSLIGGGPTLPRRVIPQIYMQPEVVEAVPVESSFAAWQNDPNAGGKGGGATSSDVKRSFVATFGIDTRPGSVSLPSDFGPDVRLALDEPFAVAVDETSLRALGVKIGEKASLNGKTVVVRAALHGYANMFNQLVFMSRQTASLLNLADNGPNVGPLLVRLRDPAQAQRVHDALNAAAHDQYKVWTRSELSAAGREAMLKNSFIGIMLGGGVVLGSIVGTLITWLTLQGAILANIKEFASLRALGVSMGSLRWIVIELSLWVGVAGLVLTGLLIWGVTLLAGLGGVPMAYPTSTVVQVVVMLMFIAVLSGLLSLGVLAKSQPADLLR